MPRAFHHRDFADLAALVAAKEAAGLRVSLCIPTLNEEGTIARVVSVLKTALFDEHRLLDELVVIDSGSTDRTRTLAKEAGAEVVLASDILPFHGSRMGKGENLWKAVYQLTGDILCFVDGDIGNIHPRFVYGTVGPLIRHAELGYVKGYYERPLLAAEGVDPRGGGRVTEILVRPLLQRFHPELAGLHQPLAGEYAARREVLEQFAMPTTYGIEIAHLLDCQRLHGAGVIGQTDLDERIHRNRSLAQLGRMSGEILDAFFARHPQPVAAPGERPPMISLPEYRERFPAAAERARKSA
ncbi:glucosyl-3-phosphoglycerate synthase [Luteolibacter flavescens]|uniref:Glucosyl-3-phosphoglycerate synthase n=1 Tax=Luteolibacter flavescens TaxID=1859460 RepID=A0ABT3FS98_9BACT|nr:glucosyl-3-phosphoglycerate synthase [Luteolibacter flavescens]MCW1886427.1 glucosyl-3-phosphoglycerate synthase [Luteolibacter flavescens]